MNNSMILGIDSSNYTTSAAAYFGGEIIQNKLVLPVAKGQRGLRQSDAVFLHIKQLPEVLTAIFRHNKRIKAIGVSVQPRDAVDSYMPCFTVGESIAVIISEITHANLYRFSHQAGHIAAALFSSNRLDLLDKEFIAFHASGGTTEAVYVAPDNKKIINTHLVAQSLDLKAGQAIDRCGVMLEMKFPCGAELEKLALKCSEKTEYKPSMKGADCSLSGIENKYRKMYENGETKEKIARFCIDAVAFSLSSMCSELVKKYGDIPILFAGGVSSCSIIRKMISEEFNAIFALPEFSSDNAAGVAILASESIKRGILP